MRADSVGPIEQRAFENYNEAKPFYDKMAQHYYFVKLCEIVLDSRDE